eukprot:1012398-Pleurochrysis_carterae.AAC.2
MAADTGRNGVVHASSMGGDVAFEVGVHACGGAWGSSQIVFVVGVVNHHELVDAGPVGVVLWWLVLSAQCEHRFVSRNTTCHFKAVAGLVGRGAEVDALVCARFQLACLHQGSAHTPGRTSGRSGSPMRSTCRALVRGLAVVRSPAAVVRQ